MNSGNFHPAIEFILNFANEFSDSYLYAYIIQIMLIGYMHKCAGSGRYWKIIFTGSIFGMFGATIEHLGTAWIKTIDKNQSKAYCCYLLAEIGWIITEFSIPYLNLIKLKVLTQSKIVKTVNWVIGFLFILFGLCRFYIGYLRLINKTLYNIKIYHLHGIAFGIIAIADGLLSILIFIELNKSAKRIKEKYGETFNLLNSFKKSSLFILFVVDLMSVILAILSIIIDVTIFGRSVNKLIKPFHALKSNFLLILAVDSFIFKMRASIDGSTVVSRYLQQSKLYSNYGDHTDEIPLSNKKYRNKKSSQVRSVNNITNNSANCSFNYSANCNTSYNMNMSSNSNSPKRIKGHVKSKSNSFVSDTNYSINMAELKNTISTDIINLNNSNNNNNNNNNMNKTSHSYSSSNTLIEPPTNRAYIKGKKLLNSKKDGNDRNNSSHSLNALSISAMTPINSNSSILKNKASSINSSSLNANMNINKNPKDYHENRDHQNKIKNNKNIV